MGSMSHTRFQQASHFKIGLTRSTSKEYFIAQFHNKYRSSIDSTHSYTIISNTN